MWSWQSVLEAAVGAAIASFPVYVFFFRQIVDAKNAQIELLKDRIGRLESERVTEVITEKNVLLDEVRAQAKEKQEFEAELRREADKLGELLSTQIAGSSAAIQDLHNKIMELADVARERIATNTQVGLLAGRISLIRTHYWWNGFTGGLKDPVAKRLGEFIRSEIERLQTLQLKVRNDGIFLTKADVEVSQEMMNELREEARSERKALNSRKTSENAVSN